MFVGNIDGEIKEFIKVGNKYEIVPDSQFSGVDVGSNSTPTIVDLLPEYPGFEVVIGSKNGRLFVFSDQGGRSNVWQGPFTSSWHGPTSNWELMTIPKSRCDNVHILGGSVLKVDPTQLAKGRTLTVRQGGQFEVKAAAELSIDPD